jgi:hypothetical protein
MWALKTLKKTMMMASWGLKCVCLYNMTTSVIKVVGKWNDCLHLKLHGMKGYKTTQERLEDIENWWSLRRQADQGLKKSRYTKKSLEVKNALQDKKCKTKLTCRSSLDAVSDDEHNLCNSDEVGDIVSSLKDICYKCGVFWKFSELWFQCFACSNCVHGGL